MCWGKETLVCNDSRNQGRASALEDNVALEETEPGRGSGTKDGCRARRLSAIFQRERHCKDRGLPPP